MNIKYHINQLKRNAETFNSLLANRNEEEIHWKKSDEKWNLLEVICHLVDEEKEDFRVRLKNVLETPHLKPPTIDPVGWVSSRNYKAQNYSEKLKDFGRERSRSLEWLTSLTNCDWEKGYDYGHHGFVTGAFFIHNWLAHDYLHIRQIVRIQYDYLNFISDDRIQYAGKWVAE